MKKIISLVFSIIIANNLFAQDDSLAFNFPLELGNRWEYISGSNLYHVQINTDVFIEGNRYFNHPLFSNFPVRYDVKDNAVYVYSNGDKLIIDFDYPDGSFFDTYNYNSGGYANTEMMRDTFSILGFKRPSASIAYLTGLFQGVNKQFTDSIGISRDAIGDRYGGIDKNVLQAIIYDSLGNSRYYCHSKQCEITEVPLVYGNNDTIVQYNITVNHWYTRWSNGNLAINYTDKVFIEHYYEKSGIRTDTSKQQMSNIGGTTDYAIPFHLNRSLMNEGYELWYRVVATDKSWTPHYTYTIFKNPILYIPTIVDELSIRFNYSLEQNFPNPFNPVTTIKYAIEKPSNVVIKIFDVLGNEVTKLVDEPKERGYYSVEFDASKLASGIYYYSISAGEFYSVKKMVLLK